METTTDQIPLLTCEEMEDLGIRVAPILLELEEEFGPDVMWEFVKNFGGTFIWLRGKHRNKGPIVDALGKVVSDFLYQTYRSGQIKVPMGPLSDVAFRLAQVRFHKLNGCSNPEIVRAVRWDQRNVERAVARLRAAEYL